MTTTAARVKPPVLRQAADTYEEQKLPYLSRIFTAVAHDPGVPSADARYLLAAAGGGARMALMEVPAVWTIHPGADREKVEDVVSRLAERLGIDQPEIKDDTVLLPAEYPNVARALDDVEPGWDDHELLIPPVP